MLAIAWMLCAFPTLPAQPEGVFALTTPEDGMIYATAGAELKNISLRYAMTGLPSATRLCLELYRGSLHVYRGPVLYRDANSLAHYAKGCFAVGQPVTLQKLVAGNYALRATAQNDAGANLATASTVVFGVDDGTRATATPARPPEFEPSYEWQSVLPGQSVPAGLEIQLSLGESHRRARIPATWRLQVYLGHGRGGFLRTDVHRDSLIGEIERAAAAQAAKAGGAEARALCATLVVGAERLTSSDSVEQAALFQKRGKLTIDLAPCDDTQSDQSKLMATIRAQSTASSSMQLALVSDTSS